MSYDFYLFKPKTGVDPIEIINELFSEEFDEINPGLPQPEKELRKRSLAEALIKLNPKLEIFPFRFQEIAEMENISEEEARIKYRHLELNGSENGKGIQITLYDEAADLTVPYWHGEEKARQVFEEIWSYLSLFEKEAGFLTFDPQLEKILNPSTDFQEVLEVYESVSGN